MKPRAKLLGTGLALLLSMMTAGAAAVAYEYRHQLSRQFAMWFEMPGYGPSRTELAILTGGRYQQAEQLLSKERTALGERRFLTYIRSRTPFAPAIERIERHGWTQRGNPAWHPRQAFDWSADPKADRNWRFKINALDHLDAYFRALASTGDARYYAVIEHAVFDWIDYNLVRNGENEFKWYDMSAGIRAARLASLYYHGVASGELDERELKLLLAAMDMHVEALKNPRYLNHGNHGLFQMLGLAAICHVADLLRSCEAAGPYAQRTFQRVAEAQFTSEGMHAEHSSQYHPWVIRMIEQMLSFGYLRDIDADFLDVAKARTIHWFYPNGEMHLLGDTGEQQACSVRRMHSYMEFLCTGGESGSAPEETFSWLPESGYVIARSDWSVRPLSTQSFLFFNAAFHSQAHRQADDLSILWYDAGRPILVDSGKYSYDTNEWRDYMKSTRAHNTVEVGESNFSMRQSDVYGSALKKHARSGDAVLMVAEVEHSRPKVNHRRLVAFSPGQALVVIDVMDGGWRAREYRQWFHFDESLQVTLDGRHLEVADEQGKRFVGGMLYASAGGGSQLVKGETQPRIQGWRSRRYREKAPNFALANKAAGREVVLATAFSLGSGFPSMTVDEASISVCAEGTGLRIDIQRETVDRFDCRP